MYRQSMQESRILDKRLVRGKMQYLCQVLEVGCIAWVEFKGYYCKIVG